MSKLVNKLGTQPDEDTRRGELRKPDDRSDQPGQGADLTPPFPGAQHWPRADSESSNRTGHDREHDLERHPELDVDRNPDGDPELDPELDPNRDPGPGTAPTDR